LIFRDLSCLIDSNRRFLHRCARWSYLGDIDMYRSNETRPLMSALKNVAERSNCTIVGVAILAKRTRGDA
jgi:hypothetical protein